TLLNSTLSGNSAASGGGVFNLAYAGANAGLTLTSSTLLGNSAALGGGVYNEAVAAGRRRVAITNSTLSGNSAGFSGGGVFNQAILSSANAELTLTNSTLSGNSASFSGGGVYNLAYAGASTLTLTRSLLSGNTAPTGAEVLNFSGTLTATDHNLLGHSGFTNAQAFAAFTPGATDITATSDGTTPTALSAILDPTLADNSGPTLTHALVSGSPAIDAVATGCPPPSTDQRGVPRPQDRSEEHTSELQSLTNLVCRLLLEKKKHTTTPQSHTNYHTTDRRCTAI